MDIKEIKFGEHELRFLRLRTGNSGPCEQRNDSVGYIKTGWGGGFPD
jgi:hypothetical protein